MTGKHTGETLLTGDGASLAPPAAGVRLDRNAWLFALAVAVVAFVTYIPALGLRFVDYDDSAYIQTNTSIRELNFSTIKWAFTEHVRASNYHPVTWLSHAVDYQLFGLNPAGHHAMNAALHALNSGLVFLLAWQLLGWRSLRGDGLVVAAGLSAVVFAIHPLHVESVAWLAERKDVLCAFFYLSALVLYSEYARRETLELPRWMLYVGALVCGALALLAKPMAVSLPAVLMILDFFPFDRCFRGRSWRQIGLVVAEKVPFVLVTAVLMLVTMAVQEKAKADWTAYPWTSRLLTASLALGYYLWKFVWPTNLACLYPLRFDISWTWASVRASWVVMATLAGTGCVLAGYGRRGLAAAVAAYIILLLPVIGIVQVGLQQVADRYMYLPSIPVVFAMAWAVGWLYGRARDGWWAWVGRGALMTAAAASCIALVVATERQIPVWQDAMTLWQTCYERTRGDDDTDIMNREAQYQYASCLYNRGDLKKARELFEPLKSWSRASRRPWIQIRLAMIYMQDREDESAREMALASMAGKTEAERERMNDQNVVLGIVALREKKFDEAIRYLDYVIANGRDAEAAFAFYNRACALSLAGRTDEALASIDEALKKGYAKARTDQAKLLQTDTDLDAIRTSEAYRELLRKYDVASAESVVDSAATESGVP